MLAELYLFCRLLEKHWDKLDLSCLPSREVLFGIEEAGSGDVTIHNLTTTSSQAIMAVVLNQVCAGNILSMYKRYDSICDRVRHLDLEKLRLQFDLMDLEAEHRQLEGMLSFYMQTNTLIPFYTFSEPMDLDKTSMESSLQMMTLDDVEVDPDPDSAKTSSSENFRSARGSSGSFSASYATPDSNESMPLARGKRGKEMDDEDESFIEHKGIFFPCKHFYYQTGS